MTEITLESLLARGYLTDELPPPFTSRSFATAIAGNLGTLPTEFDEAGQPSSKPVRHHLVRPGNLPRSFSIPNPTAALVVARIVADHWDELQGVHRLSRYAMSGPTVSDASNHRALIWSHTRRQQDARRAEIRVGARYVVRADVSLFYPSLYTHALPWALHTKAISKQQQQNMALLGNRLDRALRRGQDNQTIGIPIGPSWSLALSELIMSRVDEALQAKFPRLQGIRTIDDYEFGAESEASAERILATLRSELAGYELQLNAMKTTISTVPVPMMPAWKAQLRSFHFGRSAQADDLIRYFDLAASLGVELNTAAPMTWAAHRMRWLKIRGQNWPLVHDLLLQAILVEPGCIKNAMRSLLEHTRQGLPLNKDAVCETLSLVIARHVPLGHSSEVAWALWAAIAFEVRLDAAVGPALSRMSDSVVAILALDAESRGLLRGLDKTSWLALISKEELRSDHWLLAYEAPKKGWLGTKKHFLPEFVALDAWDVEFYDSDSLLKSVPGVSQPLTPLPAPPPATPLPTAPPPTPAPTAPPLTPPPTAPPVTPPSTAPEEPTGSEEEVDAAHPRLMDLFDVPLTVESDGEDDEPYP